MRTKERTERKKKNRIAILILLLAVIILTGASIAFFSDFVTGEVSGTAGTLDLRSANAGAVRHYTQGGVEKADTATTTITNLNPGDILDVGHEISNAGNKSAWMRNLLTITVGENHADVQQNAGAFLVYASTTSNADIRSGTATPLAVVTSGSDSEIITHTGTASVINGTGLGAETETAASGQNGPVSASYKVYFKSTAGNEYQKIDLSIAIKTEAIQYRNNTTADWTAITTTEFTIGS